MDLDQIRVQDDLRGIVTGDVVFGDLFTQMYATDASIYELRPLGVVRPRTAEDCAAVLKYAAENQLGVHPRGAGSGLAGESLGRGIILDCSRYMRRSRLLGNGQVRVQPGVVLAALNRELQATGRTYGPDPATRSVTTMGSVIAQDASGSHFLRFGSAADTVVSLQVALGTGELVEFSQHYPSEPGTCGAMAAEVVHLTEKFAEHLAPLRSGHPSGRGGYRLHRAIEESTAEDSALFGPRVNLARLMAGSEGTLAIVTEATLRTEVAAKHRGVALFFFRRLEAAARSALTAVKQGVIACDLMDRRLLEIARETDHRYDQLLPREAEAMVLVELQGDGLPELRDRLHALASELCERLDLAFAVRMTTERAERDFYWRLCRRVIPRLYRLKGSSRALPFVEDMAVPPEHLPDFLLDVQEALKKMQITASIFAHAGHGQLHLRPFLDLSSSDDQRRMIPLAEELFTILAQYNGIVCAEHGAGFSRSALLRRQLGPLWPAMVELKRIFDPQNILNPGKLVASRLPRPDENLRSVLPVLSLAYPSSSGEHESTTGQDSGEKSDIASAMIGAGSESTAFPAANSTVVESLADEFNSTVPAARLPLVQIWTAAETPDRAARQCNGCGRCRSTAPNERMCPVFRAIPAEEASPRAKANLLRGVLTGQLPPETLHDDGLKKVTDLCFHCHQCRLECPASVDIPKIVGEMKGQYVATNGLPLSDVFFCHLDTIAQVASRTPRLSNYLLGNRLFRWCLDRFLGVSQARKLPRFASQSFLRQAARQKLSKFNRGSGEKVAYFVDHYANWYDPELGRALIEILKHNRISVHVPPKQLPSGMTFISAGDLKNARKRAKHNVRILADAVRAGYKVVTTEPTAALCLRLEYLKLLDSEDARLVAANSFDACRYLWDLHCRNSLALDFNPVPARIAYHEPCHVRAIDSDQPGPQLMSLLPRLNVEDADHGCTGMAGTWGLQKKNYRNSLRIGWPLLSHLRRSGLRTASTECSACKMQIEHGTQLTTLHPIKLIAYAYGKLPELGAALGSRGN
jgi:FAD/FMN-containing dehydrogenase/Fe-S oxidoreductase